MMPDLTENDQREFWIRIQTGKSNDCWNWIGHLCRGYGLFGFRYYKYYAHQIAYFLDTGIDLGDFKVCHSCDNPACCNPKHLWLGTQADNIQDCFTKGRANHRGIKNTNSKLTDLQVLEIRKQHTNGKTQFYLSQLYGVSPGTIFFIVHRKTWKHI